MARLTFHGAEEFADKLVALGNSGEGMARMALYDGAGVVADALRQAVYTIPVVTTGKPFNGLGRNDRDDLANGIGIAKFESDRNEVTTAVSFDGYARRTESNFPGGVPLALLARSLESGSSLRQKFPFVRPAINACKAAVKAAMQKRVDDTMKKIMEG